MVVKVVPGKNLVVVVCQGHLIIAYSNKFHRAVNLNMIKDMNKILERVPPEIVDYVVETLKEAQENGEINIQIQAP